jgi:hypothetical protein
MYVCAVLSFSKQKATGTHILLALTWIVNICKKYWAQFFFFNSLSLFTVLVYQVPCSRLFPLFPFMCGGVPGYFPRPPTPTLFSHFFFLVNVDCEHLQKVLGAIVKCSINKEYLLITHKLHVTFTRKYYYVRFCVVD